MIDSNEIAKLCGWINDPREVERIVAAWPQPLFAEAAVALKDTGKGKNVLLYEAVRQVIGSDAPAGPQRIGDCVSWGWGNAVNYLECIEIALRGEAEEYQETCTEAIYALSRVEYGNLDGSYSDGSVGAWAAAAVSKGGTLSRQRLGAYDLKRAKEWGAKGLPDDLEPEARTHLVKTVSLVQSFAEARDAIANGYPVPVCSSRGFTMTRDRQGFCAPRGTWMHCMLFCGSRDDGRPGLLCAQSWGENVPDGPRDLDQPNNTFWVEAEVCDRMLRQGDSFAASQFDGYPAQTIPWII